MTFGDIGLEEQLAIFIRCAAVHLVAILIEKAELCPWELFLGICGNLLKRYLQLSAEILILVQILSSASEIKVLPQSSTEAEFE